MPDYVHQPLKQELRSISGYYILEKEVRLPYKGKEVLYVVGAGQADTACCGMGGSYYALVPGTILAWRKEANADGLAVSEVERIHDKEDQKAISALIKQKEINAAVQFL